MNAVKMQEIVKDIRYMIMRRTNFKVEHIEYVKDEIELFGGRYFFIYLDNGYTVRVEIMKDNTVDLDGLVRYLIRLEERLYESKDN